MLNSLLMSFHKLKEVIRVGVSLQVIPPEQLPKVIGELVESSLLLKMFSILYEFYVRYMF